MIARVHAYLSVRRKLANDRIKDARSGVKWRAFRDQRGKRRKFFDGLVSLEPPVALRRSLEAVPLRPSAEPLAVLYAHPPALVLEQHELRTFALRRNHRGGDRWQRAQADPQRQHRERLRLRTAPRNRPFTGEEDERGEQRQKNHAEEDDDQSAALVAHLRGGHRVRLRPFISVTMIAF